MTIIRVILYAAALILGGIFFLTRKSPLYFRLLFFGAACFFLKELYYFVDYACTGVWSDSFSFAAFGAGAGYAFLLSANYGQFDSFVDDGSAVFRKARIAGFIAPVALIAVMAAWSVPFLRRTGDAVYVILTVVCKLPAFFAAYYHLKHLLLPDPDKFLVNALRPCNAMCLAVTAADFLSDAFSALEYDPAGDLCGAIVGGFLILAMLTAERGRRGWKI